MKLRDVDIRAALKSRLRKEYAGTNTIIVDELSISWGDARIDIAVVNCSLIGYEIKSDRDTLERLPHQMKYYNKIFDMVTLVCSHRLVSKAKGKIPDWWGILVPVADDNEPWGVRFESERNPQVNEDVELRSLVELTWKEEAIAILSAHGLARGFRNRPRWDIWDHLVRNVNPIEIKEAVRECLKARQGWRKPETLQRLCVD
ncbi:sce7726 family protein [Moorella sp. Hama-1]|uniref:sce7726 family protein n=1 Tax=Moorella sp. Hama-1 TaxID=2138101 RepID=UPI0013796C07|nr:sce7726 family protein [Moorella sp. Hama-1]BCV20340.1 hypothetical protein hamaS1_04090 [Moorella sp. Hama-1]